MGINSKKASIKFLRLNLIQFGLGYRVYFFFNKYKIRSLFGMGSSFSHVK